MAFAGNFSPLLILLFIITTTTTITTYQPPGPPQDLLNAAETLSNSGYTSMSLTIQLLLSEHQSPLLFSNTTALTIFSPPDSAFIVSGQPSLSVLLLHFSPLSLSQHSLQSLPFFSTIPTLSPASISLHITTSRLNPSQISINNVNVSRSPLYDDGTIVIFGIDDFFNPNFTLVDPNPGSTPINCQNFRVSSSYKEASGVLKSRGYSIIASFLDLQLAGYMGSNSTSGLKFTMLAPLDEAMMIFNGDFLEYQRLFLIHLVPCRLSWTEMNRVKNETLFGGFVEGYGINITRFDNGELRVNGVRISAPEMYEDDMIVIHGLQTAITMPPVSPDEEEGKFLKPETERSLFEADTQWGWCGPSSVGF